MSQAFKAEVLFFNPDDVSSAACALRMVNLHYEVIPTEDPDEQTAFGMVSGTTELDENAISGWLLRIIEPFGGDVVEVGYAWRWHGN
jgi:hypothetical protein